jgi:PAS domain S-box-containing protein
VLLVKLLLAPLITPQSPFLLLAGAVLVAAWFGGFGPGLLATALGMLAADYFFLPPVGTFTGLGVAFLPLLLFVLQGLLISSLAEALRSARQRAEVSVLEARGRQERLRRSEERFRLLVQGVEDYAILMLDPEGRVTSWNEGTERINGYTAEEIVGKHVSVFYTQEDVDSGHAEEELRVAAEEGRYVEEGVRIRKDGSKFWANVLTTALRDEEGNLRGFSKIVRDISERKKAEQALATSEQRFRALVQNSSDVITVIDAEGTIRYVSPAVERIMGYRPRELVGKSVYYYVRPDNLQEAQKMFAELWSRPGVHPPFEFEVPHKDGSWRYSEFLVNNLLDDPSVRGVVVNQRDITERKEAEDKLRESEELYRNVVEQAAENIFLVDVGTKHIIQANAALQHSLGYSIEELRQLTLYDIVAHDHGNIERNVRRILEEGHLSIGERQYRCKDGSLIDVDVSVSAISYSGREIMCVVAHDVTERKKAETRFRTLVEQIPAVTYIQEPIESDNPKTITYMSPQYETMLGYPAESEVIDEEHWLRTLHPEDRERVLAEEFRTDETGEPFKIEYRVIAADGRVVWVRDHAVLVRNKEGQPLYWLGVQFDVTEQKRAEETLRRSLDALLTLYETGQMLSSSLKREEIGSSLLGIIGRVSGTTAAVISLSDDRERLHAWRTFGPENLLVSVRDEPEARVARQAAFDAEEERLLKLESPGLQEKRLAGLFIPLRVHDRVIGVLEVYGPESLAESGAVETFASLATQAASALENARLYEELAEHRRRLQDLVGKLVTAQEEERRRVAYEVHDGLAQVAAAAYQHLQNFAADNPPGSAHGQEELDQALEMLQQTVGEARNVVADLRPTVLDDFGLARALRLLVERLSGEGLLESYNETLRGERLPEVVETALFRVAQEAITNVRKHARAERVHVALERRGQAVRLQVRDWGRGFVSENKTGADPSEKVGLSSMRERVALLGGHFEIHSEPGAGTVVMVEVPLQQEPDTEGESDDRE